MSGHQGSVERAAKRPLGGGAPGFRAVGRKNNEAVSKLEAFTEPVAPDKG